MQNYRCHVTGSQSTKTVAAAKAPVYCADDSSSCVQGAKQMIAWNRELRPFSPCDVFCLPG